MDSNMYIDVNIGNDCNFRCKYCYEDEMESRTGTISDEVIQKSFKLIDGLLYKTPNIINLSMWGGEPLIHFDKVLQFLEKYKNTNRVTIMIYTNGFYIDKHIEELKKYKKNLSVQVSYDYEPCNTKNRTFKKEVTEKVQNNIRLMKESGINFWIKSTMFLSDLESNLFDTYIDYRNFTKQLDLSNIDLLITPDTYAPTRSILDFQAIEGQLKKLVKYLYENNIKHTGFTWFDRYSKATCWSPKIGCLVDIDGKMYPCHGCTAMDKEYKENFAYLNINNIENDDLFLDKFLEYLNNFDITEPDVCKNCTNCVCFRCNAHNAINTTKDLSGWNTKNHDIHCKLYTLISKYVYAYHKLVG